MVSSPNVGTSFNQLNGVAALSASNLWAVGYAENRNGASRQTLIAHWNGTSWQIVSSPNPGIASNSFSSVDAVSATNLWVVGSYANNINGPYQTLIAHWNGTSWQVVSSPNPGIGNNLLNGVVAVSATNLWAEGTYANNGYSQTLTEKYR